MADEQETVGGGADAYGSLGALVPQAVWDKYWDYSQDGELDEVDAPLPDDSDPEGAEEEGRHAQAVLSSHARHNHAERLVRNRA